MKHFWTLCILSLLVPVTPARASDAFSCPVESVVGQIGNIEGPADEVFLIRGGHRLQARARQCLIYGDKLESGRHALVNIVSVSSNLQIGRGQKAATWSAPEPGRELHPGKLDRLSKAFGELFKNPAEFSYFGASRGASFSCEDLDLESKQPLLQLNSLPAGAQKLGADVAQITVAWQPGSGSGDVSVLLSHPDGRALAKKHICRRTHCLIDIPSGAVRAGDQLVLEARDGNGTRLQWQLLVVDPAQLPQPREPLSAAWVLGAWRMVETGAEYKLDSIARLATGAEQSFAAQKLLDAVFENEKL